MVLFLLWFGGTALHAETSVERSFWNWFAGNTKALARIKTGNEPITVELTRRLQQVHPDLVWELSTQGREFIVSADGLRSAFPAVKSLVKAAPRLKGWKIVAFRPRRKAAQVTFGGVTLGPNEVFFRVTKGRRLEILHPSKVNPGNDVTAVVFLLLDQVLGEYDVETQIGDLEIQPLAGKPTPDLRPLTKLSAVVDGWKSRKK